MSLFEDFQQKISKIRDLFEETEYQIPRYQRGYAWEKQNVADFWEDIIRVYDKDDEHFFGTIILSKLSDDRKSPSSRLEVIDGQQRLLTFSILFRAIYDQMDDKDDRHQKQAVGEWVGINASKKAGRILVNDKDSEFYNDWFIKASDSRQTRGGGYTVSQKRMKAAYEFFVEELVSYAKSENLSPSTLAKNLKSLFETSKLFLLKIVVPDEADAFTIFETINAKRVDLTPAELIKNFLFSRAKRYGDDVYSIADASWDQMYAALNENDSVDTTDFIRHLYMSKEGKIIRDKELYRRVSEYITDEDSLKEFVKSLADEAAVYAAIANKRLQFNEYDLSSLKTIYSLNLTQVRPFLLSLLKVRTSQGEINKIALLITISGIRRSLVGSNPNEIESFFVKVAHDCRSKGSGYAISELAEMLINNCPTDSTIQSSIVNDGDSRISRVILAGLESELSEKRAKEMGPITLEHIMPQKPENPTYADYPGVNNSNFNHYLEKFGNLTILGGLNPSLKNKPYKIKKEKYKDSDYKLTREIPDKYEQWGAAAIQERTEEIYNLIINKWPYPIEY